MSGRDNFKRYNKLILLLEKVIFILPKRLLDSLYTILNISDSKISLLFRYLYLRKYAGNIGENIYIGKYTILKNIEKLNIGDNVSIHSFCYLDSAGGISIGNNVSIANTTSIISFDHTWDNNEIPIKYNEVKMKEIKIMDDVWIGNGVRILGGVTINSRCVIAAGAVVNSDTAKSSIFGGVPARLLKKI